MSVNEEYVIVRTEPWTVLLTIFNVVTVLTVPINVVGFYLILTKSKRESTTFICALFGTQMFLCLTCIHWSFFMCPIIFFPFPAAYAAGFLWNVLAMRSHPQFSILCFFFGSFYAHVLFALLVRLKHISRAHRRLHFNKRTMAGLIIAIWISHAVYPTVIFQLAQVSRSDAITWVDENYPNLKRVFVIPNIEVYNFNTFFWIYIFSLLLGFPFASALYVAVTVAVQYEIAIQGLMLSKMMKRYHLRTLKNLSIQTAVTGIFCGCAPMSFAVCAILPNTYDTQPLLTVAHTVFTLSSTASVTTMIGLNESYRTTVIEWFVSKKRLKSIRRQQAVTNISPPTIVAY